MIGMPHGLLSGRCGSKSLAELHFYDAGRYNLGEPDSSVAQER